VKYVAKA